MELAVKRVLHFFSPISRGREGAVSGKPFSVHKILHFLPENSKRYLLFFMLFSQLRVMIISVKGHTYFIPFQKERFNYG